MLKGMNLKASVVAALMVTCVAMMPVAAGAQTKKQLQHRQDQKNQWRNIGIGSAVLGILGLTKHDNTLAIAGLAGALYSANRYEQDRKSQSHMQQARAAYVRRGYFIKNGHRYNKKTVYKNGQKYYTFVRAR